MSAISKSRREFLQSAAKCAAAAGVLSSGALELGANPLGMPIGCQTWPVREMIAKDFPGTIKQLAKAGFQTIELCSPAGYADSGFAGLAKYKGTELRKNSGRRRRLMREFSLRHPGAQGKSGGPNCMGERCWPDADDRAKPRRPEESDDGRREASRRRIQQNGRTVGQSWYPAGPSQRGL